MARQRDDLIPGKKITTWILIADGARARILCFEGPGKGLTPALDREFATSHAPTREIGEDRPGRTFESADGARHAMEPRVDWHRFEKHLFAKNMAEVLEKAAVRDAFDRLVLVAPPQALGDLRAALGRHARERITGEINKDLTSTPIQELPRFLGEVINL